MDTDYQVEKNEMIYFYFSLKMIYAYIRVSTDKQTTENQRYEIKKFAQDRKLKISKWVDETISSRRIYMNVLSEYY